MSLSCNFRARLTMIIPPRAVLKSKRTVNAVANLSSREVDSPEGVGFDLRLSSVHVISGRGALLEGPRKTSSAKKVEPDESGVYFLMPRLWYLVSTVETMDLPLDLAGLVFPRSTLFRSGVALHTSVVPPGYVGPLSFGLSVAMEEGFEIAENARFCHLVLMQVARGATKYKGQWNYGRLIADSEEDQV